MRKVLMRKVLFRTTKAQAAIEYVHTYGWAILCILVVVGLLFYHNVTEAKTLIPTECAFLSGLHCMDVAVEDNLLIISVVNGFGFRIGNISVSLIGTCNSTANTTDGNPYGNPAVLLPNQQANYIFECQNLEGLEVIEKIAFNYTNVETLASHVKMGMLGFRSGT